MTAGTGETEDQRGASRGGPPRVRKMPLPEPIHPGLDTVRRPPQGLRTAGICLAKPQSAVEWFKTLPVVVSDESLRKRRLMCCRLLIGIRSR